MKQIQFVEGGEAYMHAQESVVVNLRTGLQARPAAFFVQEANRYAADVFIERDNKKVNAKSIMGVMSLAVGSGVEITIIAEGSDAEEAVKSLAQMVQREE
ncbi:MULTISPECIES: HPr family phosphocarrier protein [Aneurinibacillus]|jgi:catabolite repression HPr-like protein|nr:MULTISPECIES: HPr family phosphocarrier protein [Aneurinibacillus]MED0671367.1 HPr family phosphocarrier protein [Aneurinibacillus aneurinilyticus]